jgi:hypothetical protein
MHYCLTGRGRAGTVFVVYLAPVPRGARNWHMGFNHKLSCAAVVVTPAASGGFMIADAVRYMSVD